MIAKIATDRPQRRSGPHKIVGRKRLPRIAIILTTISATANQGPELLPLRPGISSWARRSFSNVRFQEARAKDGVDVVPLPHEHSPGADEASTIVFLQVAP